MKRKFIALGLMLTFVTTTAGVATAARPDLRGLLKDVDVSPADHATPPEFSLSDLAGGRVSLADLKGQPALLYFWATW